jgi:hypothetical protein
MHSPLFPLMHDYLLTAALINKQMTLLKIRMLTAEMKDIILYHHLLLLKSYTMQ